MSERTLSRMLLFFGVFLALSSGRPVPAHADAPAPDQLMRLDDRLSRRSGARVTTLSGRFVARNVRASAEGLTFGSVLSTTLRETPPVGSHIAWEDVDRIDVPSNHALAVGLGSGLVLGGILGGSIYAAGQSGNDIGAGSVVLLAVPVVVVLGALVGAQMPSWHRIYRRADAAGR